MAPAPRRDVTSALPSLPPPSLCGPSRSAHAALFPLPPPPPPPRCSAPRRPPPPPRCVCPSRRMEVLNQLVAGGQFRVIKEPLGFLKLLEWLFSIFAFATCGGYSGSLRLSLECPPPNRTHGPPLTVSFGYPFRLHQVYFEAPSCGGGPPERVFLVGDYSSAAQFFVVVGVGAFLYAPAALGGYLFLGGGYRPGGRLPRVDLGVTVALAFLWLVASCAWAAALGDVGSTHMLGDLPPFFGFRGVRAVWELLGGFSGVFGVPRPPCTPTFSLRFGGCTHILGLGGLRLSWVFLGRFGAFLWFRGLRGVWAFFGGFRGVFGVPRPPCTPTFSLRFGGCTPIFGLRVFQGSSLGVSWAFLGRLGAFLGRFWAFLGRFWGVFGRFWAFLGRFWGFRGGFLGFLGCPAPPDAPFGRTWG
ncbi:uncharacterized protein [Patagioenas fasciata]|uniref:uncharacterized protein isoform X1 n=1 Tax=Patagioenas fasciata TaxID=372321 RepID=UPI003A9978FB